VKKKPTVKSLQREQRAIARQLDRLNRLIAKVERLQKETRLRVNEFQDAWTLLRKR
jgi:peptidoglycan hydrolase CwlO-like protein